MTTSGVVKNSENGFGRAAGVLQYNVFLNIKNFI